MFGFGGKGKQLGGSVSEEGVYYLHKGERVVSATEGMGGGRGTTINISIDKPVVREEADINKLVRAIETKLQTELRRRVSYT